MYQKYAVEEDRLDEMELQYGESAQVSSHEIYDSHSPP